MDMMKKTAFYFFAAAAVSLLLTGCGRKRPREEYPGERTRLVIRLFRSMDSMDSASALSQAGKVQLLDSGNTYFRWIVERQSCNLAIQKAQKLADAGHLDDAGKAVQEAADLYPFNAEINTALQEIQTLKQVLRALETYRKSRTLDDRDLNLRTLEDEASRLGDAGFSAAVAACRETLNREIAEERAENDPPPETEGKP